MLPRLTNKELEKWLKILGSRWIKQLYIDSKIYLSKEQLDYVIEKGKNNE